MEVDDASKDGKPYLAGQKYLCEIITDEDFDETAYERIEPLAGYVRTGTILPKFIKDFIHNEKFMDNVQKTSMTKDKNLIKLPENCMLAPAVLTSERVKHMILGHFWEIDDDQIGFSQFVRGKFLLKTQKEMDFRSKFKDKNTPESIKNKMIGEFLKSISPETKLPDLINEVTNLIKTIVQYPKNFVGYLCQEATTEQKNRLSLMFRVEEPKRAIIVIPLVVEESYFMMPTAYFKDPEKWSSNYSIIPIFWKASSPEKITMFF